MCTTRQKPTWATRRKAFAHNFKQWWIALDQLGNSTLGLVWGLLGLLPFVPVAAKSWADETISAHCWRLNLLGIGWPCRVVDALAGVLGDKNHCEQSYENERRGRQLPPELRG